MENITKETEKNRALKTILKYITIIVGAAVYAVGFQFFMFPNAIVSGGIVGISMIINHFTKLPVGVMTIIMNIPLFAVAWRYFGLDLRNIQYLSYRCRRHRCKGCGFLLC